MPPKHDKLGGTFDYFPLLFDMEASLGIVMTFPSPLLFSWKGYLPWDGYFFSRIVSHGDLFQDLFWGPLKVPPWKAPCSILAGCNRECTNGKHDGSYCLGVKA